MDARSHPLAEQAYVSLTTFRRSGAPVATAVWVAPTEDGRHLAVITVDETGKVKRLRHTARVELRACDRSGRVADGAPAYPGEGVVVRDPAQVAAVRRAVVAKYSWPARVFDAVNAVARVLHLRTKPRAGILLTVDAQPTG